MTTTLREKRHRQCLDTIGRLSEQREKAFRRLAIVQNRLADERRRLARLQKELPKAAEPKLTPLPKPPVWLEDKVLEHGPAIVAAAPPPAPELPDIPEFLRRGPTPKDVAARAQIEAEQAERKAVKTKARIAKLKATQSGETRRMPLTGRAALKRIREG